VKKPSIAIVYDKFLVQGGGERVCEMLLEAFPEASLYALNARPRVFWEKKLGRRVISPFLGGLFINRFVVSALYPMAALLMGLQRVKADVVIAYSSTCGKYVRLDCHRSILYSNYPNRGLYQPERMIGSKILRSLIRPILYFMRRIERRQIYKYDFRFAISNVSRLAMLDFSGVDSEIIMPPFNERVISNPTRIPSGRFYEYFVLVSRLEPEKEVEYVIDTFRNSRNRLRVIGNGSLLAKLRLGAPENVEFLGYVDDDILANELAGARALIFPSDIEYSLVPLEAIYMGTPVIGFAAPAMREILIDVDSGIPGPNTIFYEEKSVNALRKALDRFEQIYWDKKSLKDSAKRFSRDVFINRIREIVYNAETTN
jgi:glycosyltransferase involved in cell wall biosynthesis